MSLSRTPAGGAPRLRRGPVTAAAGALLALPLALTGCAAGTGAETGKIRPDNAAVTVSGLKVQNGLVITSTGGDGPAVVSARIFNTGNGPRTLERITLPGTDLTVELRDAGGKAAPVTVPAYGSVLLGGKGNPSASVADSAEGFQDGAVQKVVFDFDKAGAVSLEAMVTPAEGTYREFGPSAPASSSASPSPSASASAGTEPVPSEAATQYPGSTEGADSPSAGAGH
ncbi:DUF461 domain-containing protein [Streptomyces polyrhachis]|uniref:DUF461 domain-containing protein n=1 Tax=Streptomyces polyrhachis TaxID=1282885 RepID=A0ABW2GGM1_9ACTN